MPSAGTAAEIWIHCELSPEAAALQREGLTPRQYLELLVQSGRYADAVEFLAHALPRREAVWWVCLGVRRALGAGLPPAQRAALHAAVEWVLEPGEAKRLAAQAAGEAADFGTAAGCCALAVYGSGGSLGPSHLPEVPPEPFMTAKAVSAGLAMAAVQVDPPAMPDLQRELIELGLAIAEGKMACPPPSRTPPVPPAPVAPTPGA